MTHQRQPRRTREQWESIIRDFDQSNLSVKDYCQQNQLSYQSFIKWRGVFSHQPSSFLDLTPKHPSAVEVISSQDWDVELQLGAQVILRLKSAQ